MNNENKNEIFIVFAERTIRRLWILSIILIILLVGSNVAWVIYESQFTTIETTTYKAEQDIDTTDGGSITINDGVTIDEHGTH